MVCIRTRPTAAFAQDEIIIDEEASVSGLLLPDARQLRPEPRPHPEWWVPRRNLRCSCCPFPPPPLRDGRRAGAGSQGAARRLARSA